MNRENGYYLVTQKGKQIIAEWQNDSWSIVGSGGFFSDDIFESIGNKLILIEEENISPIVPSEMRITEKAEEQFIITDERSAFVDGAKWMRKMLIGR